MKLMKIPNSTEFVELIEQYENKYGKLEQIYRCAVKDFRYQSLGNVTAFDVEYVLEPFLLKWGKMGRVLGFKGCSRIGEKLEEMDRPLSKFSNVTLLKADLDKLSGKIEEAYDELMNATWASDKGRVKRVGPTATAKVLHLAFPDFFMIWDSKIRGCYEFGNDGAEYVRFLANMQNWSWALCENLQELQERYGKSCTKLIDEYNWKKCWG